eukprot:694594-Pyramimonas_sp.AAC.1
MPAASPIQFRQIANFVRTQLADGVFKSADVASFARMLLGEDTPEGLPVVTFQKRLRCFTAPRGSTISLQFLPAALQAVCSITLTSDQEAHLLSLPARRSSSSCALVSIHAGSPADADVSPAISRYDGFMQDDVPKEELRDQLVAQDTTMSRLRAGKAKLARTVRVLTQRCDSLQLALHEKDDEIDRLRAMLSFRNGKRLVSVRGGYTMALKRNQGGHISCAGIVAVLGSDPERGGLRSKDVVVKFEHLACSIQRMVSKHFYQQAKDVDAVQPGLEVHAYMGDATNEEAIQKEKVHVGFVWSATLDEFGNSTVSNSCADVQPVKSGTAHEVYGLMDKQFQSVGCPSWTSDRPRGFRTFLFMLDSAGDNIKAIKMIVEYLRLNLAVAVISQFCLLHQYSLAMGFFCMVLERFQVGESADESKSCSRVASIANTWRMPGNGKLIWDTCADNFDEAVAHDVCGITPGRAVKTRWGSLSSIEDIISKGRLVLHSVFRVAFPPSTGKKRGRESTGILAEEAEEHRHASRKFRNVATTALGDPVFIIKACVSCMAQSPLREFHLWVQKETKVVNLKIDDERSRSGSAYMGPTVMSKLVSFKEQYFRDQFSELLSDLGAVKWATLLPCVPTCLISDTRALAITLVCVGACQWDMRIRSRLTDFPSILLLCVDAEPSAACDRRKAVAKLLLDRCAHGADRLGTAICDWTLKLYLKYESEFLHMSETGECDAALHAAISLARSQWRPDTQRVEGANSVLQVICKRAPSIHLPLASDRLSLKLGATPRVQDCLACHADAIHDLGSVGDRFGGALPVMDVPEGDSDL